MFSFEDIKIESVYWNDIKLKEILKWYNIFLGFQKDSLVSSWRFLTSRVSILSHTYPGLMSSLSAFEMFILPSSAHVIIDRHFYGI